MTVVRVVDPERPDPIAIAEAAEMIRHGELVAFPTETVYGLGADATSAAAVGCIFAAKGRPGYNPLIVHVPDAGRARELAHWPALAERAAAAFWPGPLTLVVPKRAALPAAVTAGLHTVAVRAPAHPVAQALLRAARRPIAAPSANRSTGVSPTSAAHVVRSLGDRVGLVLDAGFTPVGIESTVLSLAGGVPTVLRPGTIGIARLRAALGDVRVAAVGGASDEARPSPGMLDRHYAPRAPVRVFHPAAPPDAGAAREGALLIRADLPVEHPVRMPADPAGYARELYAALHRLDDLGCTAIWVEQVPHDDAWDGVRDRIARASHPGVSGDRDVPAS